MGKIKPAAAHNDKQETLFLYLPFMRNLFWYLLLAALGTGIMFMISMLFKPPLPEHGGTDYYMENFRNGYNLVTAILFFLTGVAAGLYTRLNPWWTGLSLVLVLPVLAIIESIIFHGSHNLIPFELVMYMIFAFPAIVGVYIGRVIYNRRVQRLRKN